jgi:hypothetical protein
MRSLYRTRDAAEHCAAPHAACSRVHKPRAGLVRTVADLAHEPSHHCPPGVMESACVFRYTNLFSLDGVRRIRHESRPCQGCLRSVRCWRSAACA